MKITVNKVIRRLIKFWNWIKKLPVWIFNITINKSTGIIYMLHRVDIYDTNKLIVTENLKISPEFLENFILSRRSKYDFISMDELLDIHTKKRKQKRPYIIFTLDDGYKDNFKNAFPIFKKYKIPFTLYITTDFIEEKESFLWWYILEEIILKNSSVTISTGETYKCDTKENKLQTFWQLRSKVFALPYYSYRESFNELFSEYLNSLTINFSNLILSWPEIKEMSENSLCTIGAHTKKHYRISMLNEKELEDEVCESKNIIEQKIGKKVKHFSYPFGSSSDINKISKELIINSKFETAVVSWGGKLRKYGTDLFFLQRENLTEFDIYSK